MSQRPPGRPPRGLTADEAALWAAVANTVTPLHPPRRTQQSPHDQPLAAATLPLSSPPAMRPRGRIPAPAPPKAEVRPPAGTRPLDRDGLDTSWDRKLARAAITPDFTLDLHGHSLDAAHARLDAGLTQAMAMGARLVLVITGNPRPVAAADRGDRRGAIRAKLLDWLAAGAHAGRIAAVRPAHRKHGGPGALYLVLRRVR